MHWASQKFEEQNLYFFYAFIYLSQRRVLANAIVPASEVLVLFLEDKPAENLRIHAGAKLIRVTGWYFLEDQ